MRDVTLLAVDQLIVKTHTYQQWQQKSGAAHRLRHLASHTAKEEGPSALPVSAPTREQWETLVEQSSHTEDTTATLNVIIPVYDGYAATLNTLYHALFTLPQHKTPYHVIVINDASPDPALRDSLRALADQGLFELQHHDENQGFVKTVNHGMRLHSDRDVILLNADTEVYGDWADRLAAAAQQKDVATVTPFSNHADLCSYPVLAHPTAALPDMSWEALDTLTAKRHKGTTVPLPTAVGFCMWINRHALDSVGTFDEERFGKGYGEENDFCMRAAGKGYRHLLACDVLVRHLGGISFGASRNKRTIRAYDRLHRLHPDYSQLVKTFITDDPALPVRRALDIARLKTKLPKRNVLMVSHDLGGGTQRHINALTNALQQESVGALLLQPAPHQPNSVSITFPDIPLLPNLTFSMERDYDALVDTLKQLQVRHIHVHHVIGYPQRLTDFLMRLATDLKIAYDATIHDYYFICPRINLIGQHGTYCQEPAVTECETCIAGSHSHAGGTPVWQWRQQHNTFLDTARQVFVPNEDVEQRLRRHLSLEHVSVRPHAESYDGATMLADRTDSEPLRIAVIGAMTTLAKGKEVLASAVNDAQARHLSLEYHLIGHSDHPALQRNHDHFQMTGAYQEDEVGALLERARAHLVFIPSIWPETYCYTLSIAWRFGLKPVVFDIGAPAQRIRAAGGTQSGECLPLALSQDAVALNDWFLHYRGVLTPKRTPSAVRYPSILKDYYGLEL